MDKRRPIIESFPMTAKEYMADPHAASRQAEAYGRVVVSDEAGDARLVINSNRATTTFVEE